MVTKTRKKLDTSTSKAAANNDAVQKALAAAQRVINANQCDGDDVKRSRQRFKKIDQRFETFALRVSEELRAVITDDFLIPRSPDRAPLGSVFYQLAKDVGVRVGDMVVATPKFDRDQLSLWRIHKADSGIVLTPCVSDVDQNPRLLGDFSIVGVVMGAGFPEKRSGRPVIWP